MEAYVITLIGDEYSERVADRCIASANIPVKKFAACTGREAASLMAQYGLRWTWGDGYRGMEHKPYGGNNNNRIGCFLSHYELWRDCVRDNEDYLILEHDAVFVRPFNEFEFESACMINDPLGATPRGDWWHEQMVSRGPGVWPKTRVFDDTRPDGLAGGSAYVIKPETARRLVDFAHRIGAWPNDALLCRQLVYGLQEHYPFITQVEPEKSTI